MPTTSAESDHPVQEYIRDANAVFRAGDADGYRGMHNPPPGDQYGDNDIRHYETGWCNGADRYRRDNDGWSRK